MIAEFEIIQVVAPALVAGVMIVLIHAPLGIEVLKRGIIFIDLAVAQIAGLGLVAANVFLDHPSELLVQFVALGSAIIAGVFFRKIERNSPDYQEAIIGCSFVLAASLTILVLADHPHGGQEIQHVLSGQLLFVTWADVARHLPVYVSILSIWFLKPYWRRGIGFYILFSFAITSSVQLTGVYIVFSSLILPALAVVRLRRPHLMAWTVGVAAFCFGIIIAVLLDLPAGPVIVVSFVFLSLTTSGFKKVLGV